MAFGKLMAIILGLSFAFAMPAEAKVKVDFNIGVHGPYYDPYNDPYYDGDYGLPDYDYPRPSVVKWKCFAVNRRGDEFSGTSRDQSRAMDRAVDRCYDANSRRCTPLWDECRLVRVRR